MTLTLVSRAASERLGILIKYWRVLHDRLLLGRCCRGFVLPVLEYCSAVGDLKLLDGVDRGASFLTWLVIECVIAYRRSVEVLCMLYKIRCNPKYPNYGALPAPNVPVRFTLGSLVPHRFT